MYFLNIKLKMNVRISKNGIIFFVKTNVYLKKYR